VLPPRPWEYHVAHLTIPLGEPSELTGFFYRRITMRIFKNPILFAIFVLVIGVVSTSAQLSYGSGIHFTMDEPFTVNGKVFAPGKYVISRSTLSTMSPSAMTIRGESSGAAFDTDYTRTPEASNQTLLIFNNIDGANVLTGIRVRGELVGNTLKMTPKQKLMIARHRPAERVVIADTSSL